MIQDVLRGNYYYLGHTPFTKQKYQFQVFDMDNSQRIWEQELYNEMVYKNPTSTFHTFEGESAVIGLSFADNREAEDFKGAVMERYCQLLTNQNKLKPYIILNGKLLHSDTL